MKTELNVHVTSKVKAAAAMLDREVPGWHQMVDLDDFHMMDCNTCVLGHVFGPKMETRLRFILGPKTPTDIGKLAGFAIGKDYLVKHAGHKTDGSFGSNECYWVHEIADRRVRDELELEQETEGDENTN